MKASENRSRSGMTLVEIMVGIVIAAFVGYVASQLIGNVSKQSARVSRSSLKTSVLDEWSRSVVKIFSSTSLGRFNPETSLVPRAGAPGTFEPASLVKRGPAHASGQCNTFGSLVSDPDRDKKWCLAGGTESNHIGKSKTSPTRLGAFQQALSSHEYASLRLKAGASGSMIETRVEGIFMSRCLDSRLPTSPTKWAEINALKRPLLVGGIPMCCNLTPNVAATSGCERIADGVYWPVIFNYKDEGNVSMLPTIGDHRLVPGLGFFIAFNANPATSYTLHTISVVNRCLTSAAGSTSCAEPKLGWSPSKIESLVVSTSTSGGTVSGDMNGSAFIRFGSRKLEK